MEPKKDKWIYIENKIEKCLVCGSICKEGWNEKTSTCNKCVHKVWWRDF